MFLLFVCQQPEQIISHFTSTFSDVTGPEK